MLVYVLVLVFVGTCRLVCAGTCWCILICNGTKVLVRVVACDPYWCNMLALVHRGTSWYVVMSLVKFSVFWYILISLSTHWLVLLRTGTYMLVGLGKFWYQDN